jgi:PadR family transcriptional regulator, regulatory protein PadR
MYRHDRPSAARLLPAKPIPPELGRPGRLFDIPSAAMYSAARYSPSDMMDINKDLIAASSTPIVLAILAEEASYGYAILKRVRELSGGRLEWTDGMLYPVLHRLERLGYIDARWRIAESGRRRKYYRITRRGREQLAEERRQWQAVDATLRGVWRALAQPVAQGA